MLKWLFKRKTLILHCLLSLIAQLILTLLLAVVLYESVRLFVNQLDVDKEYFPKGHRFYQEQQLSNDYRLEISRKWLTGSRDFKASFNCWRLAVF